MFGDFISLHGDACNSVHQDSVIESLLLKLVPSGTSTWNALVQSCENLGVPAKGSFKLKVFCQYAVEMTRGLFFRFNDHSRNCLPIFVELSLPPACVISSGIWIMLKNCRYLQHKWFVIRKSPLLSISLRSGLFGISRLTSCSGAAILNAADMPFPSVMFHAEMLFNWLIHDSTIRDWCYCTIFVCLTCL